MFKRHLKAFAFAFGLALAAPAFAQVSNPGVSVSGSPANNDCAKFVVSGGNVQSITTVGAACGSGGSTNIAVGTTAITSGVAGRVLYDNTGVVGEYTQTQLTAQISLATASLSGAVPAYPNNTTTYLRGDLSWQTLSFAALQAKPTTLAGYGITSPLDVAQGGTASNTLTANAVLLGAGAGALQFATIGTTGRVLIDQGPGANPAFVVVSGDIGCAQTGACTIAATAATATRIAAALAAANNAAPLLKLYNANTADINTYLAAFGNPAVVTGISGTVLGVPSGAGIAGVAFQTVRNDAGGCVAGAGMCTIFSVATSGYNNITATGTGNYAYAMFARVDSNNANGSAVGLEVDCNNVVVNSTTTLPPNLAAPVVGSPCIGIQSANIGAKNSLAAFRAVTIGQIGGPASWVVSYYADPPTAAGNLFGMFIDAGATLSPIDSMYLRNSGQGSNVHLVMQTMGTAIPNNPVVEHLNAAGAQTWAIDQNGAATLPVVYGGTSAASFLSLEGTSSGSPSGDAIKLFWQGLTRTYASGPGAVFSGDTLQLTSNTAALPAPASAGINTYCADNQPCGTTLNSFGINSAFAMRRADGTMALPAQIAGAGEILGQFGFVGYDGSAAYTANLALVRGYSEEAFTGVNNHGTSLRFHVTPIGQGVNAEGGRFSVNNGGATNINFLVGTATDPGGAGNIVAASGILAGGAFTAKGSVPTGTTGSCVASAFTGGATAGKFSAAVCAAGTIILSGLPAAPNGYTCTAQDQTTPADTLKQTANTVTSVTFTATTVAADVVAFQCMAW